MERSAILMLALLSGCYRSHERVGSEGSVPSGDGGSSRGQMIAIEAGAGDTCALYSSGTVRCWGWNYLGSLGTGTPASSTTPVPVSGLTDAVEIALSENYRACARHPDGTIACWGGAGDSYFFGLAHFPGSDTPHPIPGLDDAVEITMGIWHACARRESGAVVCWGLNSPVRVLGSNPHESCSGSECAVIPVPVDGLNDAVEIAAGWVHTCARRASGTVVCWGRNGCGELGDGTTDDRRTPVAVVGLNDAVEIAAGEGFTCARRRSGAVVCWGDDSVGELGDVGRAHSRCRFHGSYPMPSSHRPVAVLDIEDAAHIAAGGSTACAILSAGDVRCWGAGALGNGDRASSDVPVSVVGLHDAVDITVGEAHVCARTPTSAFCWGPNVFGEIGDGTTIERLLPTRVLQR